MKIGFDFKDINASDDFHLRMNNDILGKRGKTTRKSG